MDGGVITFEIALTLYLAALVVGMVELFRSSRLGWRLLMTTAGAAFAFHTISIVYRYGVAHHLPITSPHEAASFFAWCVMLLFFAIEIRYKVKLLGSFTMPVVFFLMFIASMLNREVLPLAPVLQSNWLGVHTFFAFLANAAFALACGTGVMYLVQEHYLKSKRLGDLFGRLPSVQTLDYIGYRLITIGFPLLTLAIITGVIWAEQAWGRLWRWDPREVWSMTTWLIYATILHMRLLAGWRGRRAAVLSVVGFVTVLIAFFGIKLLQKGLHVFQ
jgi:cytochrome c-type biogenesis protein CcsB